MNADQLFRLSIWLLIAICCIANLAVTGGFIGYLVFDLDLSKVSDLMTFTVRAHLTMIGYLIAVVSLTHISATIRSDLS